MRRTARARATLAALLALAALALALVAGCGSGQEPSDNGQDASTAAETAEETSADADGVDAEAAEEASENSVDNSVDNAVANPFVGLEALSVAAEAELVSDGEHLCFYYESESWDQYGGPDGVYCADIGLTGATLVFEDRGSSPLCLDDGVLYVRESIGVAGVDLSSHTIGLVTERAGGIRSIDPYAPNEEGSGAFLCVTNDEQLVLAQPGEDGVWTSEVLGGWDDLVRYAHMGDGVAYFVHEGGGYYLCSYNLQDGSVVEIADIASEWSFVVVGSNVYYMVRRPIDDPDDQFANERELMWSDAAGNEHSTGIRGDLGVSMLAYGDWVFFDDAAETTDEYGETVYIGRPGCYNTVTGETTSLYRDEFADMSVYPLGIAEGYLYFKGYTIDEVTGEERCHAYFAKLDGTGDLISADELTSAADETDEARTWKEERDRAESEAAEAAYQESIANEPYGPGESKLYLDADGDLSVCYRLVRVDDTTEFQVLLAPGESTTQTFPSGRYTLKIAEGETWISDEEAFGPDGNYDTTQLFTFEEGESYTIGVGSRGDFFGDSQGGFLG